MMKLSRSAQMTLTTALAMGGMSGIGFSPVRADSSDAELPLTSSDVAAIAKAQDKRRRKALKAELAQVRRTIRRFENIRGDIEPDQWDEWDAAAAREAEILRELASAG